MGGKIPGFVGRRARVSFCLERSFWSVSSGSNDAAPLTPRDPCLAGPEQESAQNHPSIIEPVFGVPADPVGGVEGGRAK
jgi:hypothetical protein